MKVTIRTGQSKTEFCRLEPLSYFFIGTNKNVVYIKLNNDFQNNIMVLSRREATITTMENIYRVCTIVEPEELIFKER